ncbi:hypothetical protein [Salininema proteolyticum]|uniref:Uncharacterized protein n=1 Tax=Salininema proteolyticum TaxID=1607685 RepID=A0ABV8TZG8_9ACTN
MEHSDHFKATMRALALAEPGAADLIRDIPEGAEEAWGIYASAMFTAIMERTFKDDQSRDAANRYIDQMRHACRNVEPPLKTLVLEGIVRVVLFDEDHLLDEISSEEQLRAQLLAIRNAVITDDFVSANLENYLADANTIADYWLTAEE